MLLELVYRNKALQWAAAQPRCAATLQATRLHRVAGVMKCTASWLPGRGLRSLDRLQPRHIAQPLKDEEGDAGVGAQPHPGGQPAAPQRQHALLPHNL